jgi:L-ascorbate metabolism protein UlaG (beta-lactamase superfamily)
MGILRACVVCLIATLLPWFAHAGCSSIAMGAPRVTLAAATADAIRVTFLGHASFLIESPGGVRAVTDYNGINIPSDPPDIATMNHAHSTHFTDQPDPRIKHVMRGWRDDGKPADIDLAVGDMHVSNLPTNIRDWQGGTETYGNSVFLFETAGVCIAHLSHLHHLLTDQDLVLLGHVDVVMAPVDGVYTMSQQDMAKVLDQLHPRLVLPMHYFTRDVAERFVNLVRDRYAIKFDEAPAMQISRATLPERPTIEVLPPGGY